MNNLISKRVIMFLIVLMLFSQLVYGEIGSKCNAATFNEIYDDIVSNLKQQNVAEVEARELAKAAIDEVAGAGLTSLINDIGIILEDTNNPNRFSDAAELVTKENYFVSSELRNALLKVINQKAKETGLLQIEEVIPVVEERITEVEVPEEELEVQRIPTLEEISEEDLEELAEASKSSEKITADGKAYSSVQSSLEDIINGLSSKDEKIRQQAVVKAQNIILDVKEFTSASYELMTDHNTAPSLVYEKILNALLRGDEKLDLAVINLPITLLNEIDKSLKTADNVKEKLFNRLKQELGSKIQLAELDGESIGYLGTRIILTGLTKDELIKVTQIFNDVVREVIASSKPEIKNKLESNKDKINAFIGHTTIKGESLKGIDPASKVILSEGLIVDAIKDAIGAAETVEKNSKSIGSNILIFDDVKDKEIEKQIEKNRNKYVPPFEFSTGKLPRLRHKRGLVDKVAIKNLEDRLKDVSNTKAIADSIKELEESLRSFYLESLLDNRFDKTFKKNAMQIIVDLHKNNRKALEELLEGSQITPGLYVTKLGDEIALLYEVDGKLVMTFAELDKFNAFNSLYIPDARDGHYHSLISNIINYAKDFGVSKGISKSQNQEFISGLQKSIEETELLYDEDVSLDLKTVLKDGKEQPITITLSNGKPASQLKKGDRIKIKDARFHDTEKENGKRVSQYNADETPKLTALSVSVTSDPETEVTDFDEDFRELSELNGAQKKKLGRGKSFTVEQIQEKLTEPLVPTEISKEKEEVPKVEKSVEQKIKELEAKIKNIESKLYDIDRPVFDFFDFLGNGIVNLFRNKKELETELGSLYAELNKLKPVKELSLKDTANIGAQLAKANNLDELIDAISQIDNQLIQLLGPGATKQRLTQLTIDAYRNENPEGLSAYPLLKTKLQKLLVQRTKERADIEDQKERIQSVRQKVTKSIDDLVKLDAKEKRLFNRLFDSMLEFVSQMEYHNDQHIMDGAARIVEMMDNMFGKDKEFVDLVGRYLFEAGIKETLYAYTGHDNGYDKENGAIDHEERSQVLLEKQLIKEGFDSKAIARIKLQIEFTRFAVPADKAIYFEELLTEFIKNSQDYEDLINKLNAKAREQDPSKRIFAINKIVPKNDKPGDSSFDKKEFDFNDLITKGNLDDVKKLLVAVRGAKVIGTIDILSHTNHPQLIKGLWEEFLREREKALEIKKFSPAAPTVIDQISESEGFDKFVAGPRIDQFNMVRFLDEESQIIVQANNEFFSDINRFWQGIKDKDGKIIEKGIVNKEGAQYKLNKNELTEEDLNNFREIIRSYNSKVQKINPAFDFFNYLSIQDVKDSFNLLKAAGATIEKGITVADVYNLLDKKGILAKSKEKLTEEAYSPEGSINIALTKKTVSSLLREILPELLKNKEKPIVEEIIPVIEERIAEKAEQSEKLVSSYATVDNCSACKWEAVSAKTGKSKTEIKDKLPLMKRWLVDKIQDYNELGNKELDVDEKTKKESKTTKELLDKIVKVEYLSQDDTLTADIPLKDESFVHQIEKDFENEFLISENDPSKIAKLLKQKGDEINGLSQEHYIKKQQLLDARDAGFFSSLWYKLTGKIKKLQNEFDQLNKELEKLNKNKDDLKNKARNNDFIDLINLDLMNNNYEGGMLGLWKSESQGGNAKAYGNYVAAGTNFIFDSKTGEIIYFGNTQDIPKDIRKLASGSATFRIAGSSKGRRIIEIHFDGQLTEDAKNVIKNSVDDYNKKSGIILEEVSNDVKIFVNGLEEGAPVSKFEEPKTKPLIKKTLEETRTFDELLSYLESRYAQNNPIKDSSEKAILLGQLKTQIDEIIREKDQSKLTKKLETLTRSEGLRTKIRELKQNLEKPKIDVKITGEKSAQVHVEGRYNDGQVDRFEESLEDNLHKAKAWTREELDAARKRKDCGQGSINCDISLNNPDENKDKIQKAAEEAVREISEVKPREFPSNPEQLTLEELLAELDIIKGLLEGASAKVYIFDDKGVNKVLKVSKLNNEIMAVESDEVKTREQLENEWNVARKLESYPELKEHVIQAQNKYQLKDRRIALIEEEVRGRQLQEAIDNNELELSELDEIVRKTKELQQKFHNFGFNFYDWNSGNIYFDKANDEVIVRVVDYGISDFNLKKSKIDEGDFNTLFGHSIDAYFRTKIKSLKKEEAIILKDQLLPLFDEDRGKIIKIRNLPVRLDMAIAEECK